MDVQKVPPLEVLIDPHEHRSNFGFSSLMRILVSLRKMGSPVSVTIINIVSMMMMIPKRADPRGDQPLLSISHQCHDPDQQTNIDHFHPKNGHSKEEDIPEWKKRADKIIENYWTWPDKHSS